MPKTTCPSCDGAMQVDEGDLGYELECPHCAARFTPPKPKSIRRPADVVEKAFADDDDDDDDYRPRRRRPRRRSAYDPPNAREREAAIARAGNVGLWMMIVGYGSTMIYLMVTIGLGIAAMVGMNNRNPKVQQANDDEFVWLLLAGCCIVFGILPSIPMIIGGHMMRSLDRMTNPFWVYAGALLGFAGILICTISPITWASCGVGVWALVAVNDADVQRVMRSNSTEREGTDEDA